MDTRPGKQGLGAGIAVGLSTLAVDDQLREKALPAGPDELAEALTDHIYLGLHRA